MKKYGCTFEYEQERNKELMKVFRELLAKAKIIRLDEIWEQMAAVPSSRFWVSEERASVVVTHIMSGCDISTMHPMKRNMFIEIYRRFSEMRRHDKAITVRKACSMIVCQPAPSFYLTPASIRVIVYKIRRGWYKHKKKKQSHGN